MTPKIFFIKKVSLFLTICLCSVVFVRSQITPDFKKLDSLITSGQFSGARELISDLIQKKENINLGRLVYPMGKLAFLQNTETDFKEAQELLSKLKAQQLNDSIIYEALLGMGLLHVDQGTVLKAQEYVVKANKLSVQIGDTKRKFESEFHLSEIALKLGDFNQLLERTDNALDILLQNKEINFPLAPRVYNYKASLMHFSAMPDSANHYFKKAIKSIDKTSKDPEYTDYLPGTIYGNWFMVKQTGGNYEEAMQMTLKSIGHYTSFLEQTKNHQLTEKVHGNLTIGYRNLGSLYYDLGNKEKAKQIATLGYNHAKKYFLPNTIQYFGAALMMGESLLYNTDLKEAEKYLKEAKTSLVSIPGDNFSYQANLYGTLGDLAYRKDDYTEAVVFFEKTIEAYKNSNPDGFGQNEVYALINLARSHSNLNNFDESEEIIDRTLSRVVEVHGKNSYLANEIRITKVKTLFDKKDYNGTIELSNQVLDSYKTQSFNSIVNEEFFKPNQLKLLLYLIKANYETDTIKSPKSLQSTTAFVDKALESIEKRKSLVTTEEDVNILLEDSRDLFDFAKKIYLQLYDKSKDKKYLGKVLELHESSIYHRIRTRLNLTENQLAPESVREEENQIRTALNSFFNLNGETQFNVDDWEENIAEWEKYLSTIKEDYPQYYEMRYKSVLTSLSDLQKNIGSNSTVVRYLLLENKPRAIVLTQNSMDIVSLSSDFSSDCIEMVSNYQKKIDEVSECLSKLYQLLWQPLEDKINTKNVIIFPDQELFNLSFELLTPKKINSFNEMANNSLLAKYNIAYNYSLLLLDDDRLTFEFEDDFVAYAPAFDEDMKKEYELAITDSINLDKTYLTLLPQPFSADIVKRFSKRFRGTSFLNKNASKAIFAKTANEHKIIHIGTHAESNNSSPSLSRLVFAKDITDTININDNYLYAYEIYNQNLNSNLAILTACETGKPSYQPGEGMISLAHAFNYAGSESILTSLWQIDEQSSTQILDYFYSYLENGSPKDEALRNAKLDYLKNASGRTLHPQYWAGLILMGDTAPIVLTSSSSYIWSALICLLVAVFIFFDFKKRKAFNSN